MTSSNCVPVKKWWRRRAGSRLLGLVAATLGCTSIPVPLHAGELEYQNCLRRLCSSYGKDESECVQSCLADLNGPTQSIPLPPIPILYGAIAVDKDTLIPGSAKNARTKAAAERQALDMCRRGGGSASGCQIIESGHNVCLALATSHDKSGKAVSWGSAWSDDGWVTRRNAMRECGKQGGVNCKIVVTLCTG